MSAPQPVNRRRRRLIALAVIAAAGSACWLVFSALSFYSSRARRAWKDAALGEIRRLADDEGWVAGEISLLAGKEKDRSRRVIVKGWLTDRMILMKSGEWLVYRSHCPKRPPHDVADIFLARASNGKWYYSTCHFCVGMCALVMTQAEEQPPDLKTFARAYHLEEFDGESDECLRETKTMPDWDALQEAHEAAAGAVRTMRTAGSPFRIAVTLPRGDTGNTHYAESVEIACGGKQPLVLKTDMEAGVLAPLMGREESAGSGSALLLGWSSWGGGMQTVHALLVRAGAERVALADRLDFTTDRSSAGILVLRRGGKLWLGIPRPGQRVHEPTEWNLSVGGKRLALPAIRELPYADRTAADASATRYPAGSALGRKPVAWFAAEESGISPGRPGCAKFDQKRFDFLQAGVGRFGPDDDPERIIRELKLQGVRPRPRENMPHRCDEYFFEGFVLTMEVRVTPKRGGGTSRHVKLTLLRDDLSVAERRAARGKAWSDYVRQRAPQRAGEREK